MSFNVASEQVLKSGRIGESSIVLDATESLHKGT